MEEIKEEINDQVTEKKKPFKCIRIIIGSILFVAILLSLAINGIYILRYDENNMATKFIKGFYALDENSIDVMFIGSSAVYRYSNPLVFYKETGITSYDFCSPSMPLEAVKYLINEAEQTQDPKLYVIDLRHFYKEAYLNKYSRDYFENVSRTVFNNMPVSLNRAMFVHNYISGKLGENDIEYQLEYPLMHNNWENLTWDDVGNYFYEMFHYKEVNGLEYKGAEVITAAVAKKVKHFSRADIDSYKQTVTFTDEQLSVLNDLIQYIKEKDLPVLFMLAPYVIQEENYACEVFLKNYVEEQGMQCMMCNSDKIYDEMDLNFYTDFYNEYHANASGQKKYTKYVANYIKKKYNLSETNLTEEQKKDWEDTYNKWKTDLDDVAIAEINKVLAEDGSVRVK